MGSPELFITLFVTGAPMTGRGVRKFYLRPSWEQERCDTTVLTTRGNSLWS